MCLLSIVHKPTSRIDGAVQSCNGHSSVPANCVGFAFPWAGDGETTPPGWSGGLSD